MGRLFSILLLAALFVTSAFAASVPSPQAHRHARARALSPARSRYAAELARRGPRPATRITGRPHPVASIHRPASIRRVATARYAHIRAVPEATAPNPVPEPAIDRAAPEESAPETTAEASVPDRAAPGAASGLASPAHLADPVKAPTPASLAIPRKTVPPLRGSRESLVRQNEKTEAEGLERILDSDDLNDRIARGLLVPVPASSALTVNASLPEELRYCRQWTANFLTDFARAHDALFHRPIVVSSAVRTVAYQRQLEKVNGNAAPAEGDIVSPHLTGSTIDVAKADLPRQELSWMRAWLKNLQAAGQIDVEEEFQQACFHITVYQNYASPSLVRKPGARPKSRRRRPSLANALAARTM